MQGKVCSKEYPLFVWNRTPERSKEHSRAYGTHDVQSLLELSQCSVLFLSLPTTKEAKEVLTSCKLTPGMIIVDTTSGVPADTKALAEDLAARDIIFIDCPGIKE